MSPPRGGFRPDDPNQQIVAEDIFDEYGGKLNCKLNSKHTHTYVAYIRLYIVQNIDILCTTMCRVSW